METYLYFINLLCGYDRSYSLSDCFQAQEPPGRLLHVAQNTTTVTVFGHAFILVSTPGGQLIQQQRNSATLESNVHELFRLGGVQTITPG